jgi:methionine aminotransferase
MDFTSQISSKLPYVGTTIFTQMSALANKHNAINLSQGFPDFDIDPLLPKLVNRYSKKGYNQYAPMAGVKQLREVIAKKIAKKYTTEYNPESEITITAGATQAIFTAITAIVKENDEVIIFTPAYDCYSPAIELNGGICKHIPLSYPDYKIDWDLVKNMISNKTRMIIINSPHNPTGTLLTKEDIKQLEIIVKGSKIILLSDEVYEHIVFDKQKHLSVIKSPILAQQSIVTFSFGKSLHVTGWKIGYCVAPEKLMNEFRKVHQFNVFSCNTPTQYGIAEYIETQKPFKGVSKMYQQKRDLFLDLIKESRFEFVPTEGTYFQLLNYKNISTEKDIGFANFLTKEHKIASIPVSVFYKSQKDDNVLRFCFAKEDKTLIKAAKILCQI